MLEKIRHGFPINEYRDVILKFITYDKDYFSQSSIYKDSTYYPTGFLELSPDWYEYTELNILATYIWGFPEKINISKTYYEKRFWSNKAFFSSPDTTLNIDKSILPYYKNK